MDSISTCTKTHHRARLRQQRHVGMGDGLRVAVFTIAECIGGMAELPSKNAMVPTRPLPSTRCRRIQVHGELRDVPWILSQCRSQHEARQYDVGDLVRQQTTSAVAKVHEVGPIITMRYSASLLRLQVNAPVAQASGCPARPAWRSQG